MRGSIKLGGLIAMAAAAAVLPLNLAIADSAKDARPGARQAEFLDRGLITTAVPNSSELRVYATTASTRRKLRTLMHDPVYRLYRLAERRLQPAAASRIFPGHGHGIATGAAAVFPEIQQ